MAHRLKPAAEQVIVITCASSGIGLATAQLAARQGARVVLAARSGPVLDDITNRIRAAGGQALAVITDVAVRDDLDRLARHAAEHLSRIGTWVNNAGVGIWGGLRTSLRPTCTACSTPTSAASCTARWRRCRILR